MNHQEQRIKVKGFLAIHFQESHWIFWAVGSPWNNWGDIADMTETSELDGIAVNRDYKNILQWNIGILQCISVILNPIYIYIYNISQWNGKSWDWSRRMMVECNDCNDWYRGIFHEATCAMGFFATLWFVGVELGISPRMAIFREMLINQQNLGFLYPILRQTPKWIPSGKLTVCYWKWPFIVDLPIKHGDSP